MEQPGLHGSYRTPAQRRYFGARVAEVVGKFERVAMFHRELSECVRKISIGLDVVRHRALGGRTSVQITLALPPLARAKALQRCDSEYPGGDLGCLLYTSDAADERSSVDLGGRRI